MSGIVVYEHINEQDRQGPCPAELIVLWEIVKIKLRGYDMSRESTYERYS